MNRILEKFYPIYIAVLIGVPTWIITYFSIQKKCHDVFWFMMIVYVLFIVGYQIKWARNH